MSNLELPEDLKECIAFHGHLCPGIVIGYCAAKLGMRELSAQRAGDEELISIVENDTCAVDAIQVLTGCTFGKGNIRKLHYGKWGLTLIEKRTGRAVRVWPKAEVMAANKQTDFFQQYRIKGIPASEVPDDVVDNQVRLQLFVLAYNLGNFLRRLALPNSVKHWSLTTLREKLIKIGAKVVTHARYVIFQMAEVAVPKRLFRAILERIRRLRMPETVPG